MRNNYRLSQRQIPFILYFILAPLGLSAQNITRIVQGTLVNEQNEPVSFATVALKESDKGKLLSAGVSDEQGAFSLPTESKTPVYVEVSMVGYITQGQTIDISQAAHSSSWILIADPNALEEVTVTAKRDRLTRKIDRLVMEVENNAAFSGRSSLALFSSAPGVFVNNGQIAINGVPGAKVMVNGRLLNLAGDELRSYLENLKADDIKAIEIIAHPPAEYDAEGTGGLINIILKTNREFGLTGRLGTTYSIGLGKYPAYRPNVALDYKKGKITASVNYAYSSDKSFQRYEQRRKLTGEGTYTARNESIDTSQNNQIRAAMTYDINEHHFLGIDYSGRYGTNNSTMVSSSNLDYPGQNENIHAVGDFPSIFNRKYSNVGLNYIWTTDTLNSKLTVTGDITYNNLKASSGTNSQTYQGDGGKLIADTLFNFLFPSVSKIYTGELKYQKNFRSSISLSLGAKVSSTNIDNENSYNIVENGQELRGVNAFDYLYRERVYAGFASVKGTFHGVDFSFGLRGEQSEIKGDLFGSGQDTSIASNYFNLFPNASLQKQLSEDGMHSLTLSYSKRISRPSYSYLNPYTYYLDNYSVATGNPYLRPQFRHAMEIGYLMNKRYYFALSYARIKDVINEVIETDSQDNLMRALRKNTGRFDVVSATFSVPLRIANWWTATNNIILDYKTSLAPEFDLKRSSFLVQTEQSITLPKDWSMNLTAFYTPRQLTGNLVTGRMASVDMGIRREFLAKRLEASVNISDIFYTNNFKLTSYYNSEQVKIRKTEQSRMLTMSLVYKFNMGKAFQTRKIEKSNTDEQGRL